MDSVTVAQAKARLSEILDEVLRGRQVTITRRGRPVATLQPLQRPRKPIDLSRIDAVRRRLPAAQTDALELVRTVRSERS
ncbi:MAG: type II toxin-antitoxin system prevent-host-death family antitoxin [Gammaproteobacteria bacterium]|nr:type II toxin-antitoxin system prevent-host-death family antitoxin [Gammaproteobacteria bacterium]